MNILQLNSPVGGKPLIYEWPLKVISLQDLIEIMTWILEDLPLFETALQQNVLQNYNPKDYKSVKALCARFNKGIDSVVQMEKGTSLKMKRVKKIPSKGFLIHIMKQVYNESIEFPEKLNHYQGFSPEVYGEMSSELIYTILEQLKSLIQPNDVFIDLGSGVGQVVLQVSASTVCKMVYGIEKEKIRSNYAKIMDVNFKKLMDWYGKSYKNYLLIKGDFFSPENVALIKKCTIIFVNNFSFGPEVDHKLNQIFLQMPDGVKIISTKNFCPMNIRLTDRNINDISAIMKVEKLENLEGGVSWTNKKIPIYLHQINRNKLIHYFKNFSISDHSYYKKSILKFTENVNTTKNVASNSNKNVTFEKSTENIEPNDSVATKSSKNVQTRTVMVTRSQKKVPKTIVIPDIKEVFPQNFNETSLIPKVSTETKSTQVNMYIEKTENEKTKEETYFQNLDEATQQSLNNLVADIKENFAKMLINFQSPTYREKLIEEKENLEKKNQNLQNFAATVEEHIVHLQNKAFQYLGIKENNVSAIIKEVQDSLDKNDKLQAQAEHLQNEIYHLEQENAKLSSERSKTVQLKTKHELLNLFKKN